MSSISIVGNDCTTSRASRRFSSYSIQFACLLRLPLVYHSHCRCLRVRKIDPDLRASDVRLDADLCTFALSCVDCLFSPSVYPAEWLRKQCSIFTCRPSQQPLHCSLKDYLNFALYTCLESRVSTSLLDLHSPGGLQVGMYARSPNI